MIIVLIIGALLVGIIIYYIRGVVVTDMAKASRIILATSVFLILTGFITYKINKGVHALPEGAYYIDEDDITDDGLLRNQSEADTKKLE